MDTDAKPNAVHVPALVPLHRQVAVKAGLEQDVKLGVLERVPLDMPVGWQSRMHITAKHDGSPWLTIDYQAVNAVSPRQTHYTSSPWKLVLSIPGNVRKTAFDAFYIYHSLPFE